MSDLDDINHNVQLGNLGQIAGRIQQRELIRQQEELLDFKRKEHEERKRKSELPKCPACQSSIEKKSTVCPQCGLRITVFKIDSFWSSVQICATKNLGQVIQSTVSSLTKLQTEPIQKIKRYCEETIPSLNLLLRLVSSESSIRDTVVQHGQTLMSPHSSQYEINELKTKLKKVSKTFFANKEKKDLETKITVLAKKHAYIESLSKNINSRIKSEFSSNKGFRELILDANGKLIELNRIKKESSVWANDWNTCVALAKKCEFQLPKKMNLLMIIDSLKSLCSNKSGPTKFIPGFSDWETTIPKMILILKDINKISEEEIHVAQEKNCNDNRSITDCFFIKLLNENIIGPYTKNQIKDGIAKNKIPAGCFFSKSENGPWKVLKIS